MDTLQDRVRAIIAEQLYIPIEEVTVDKILKPRSRIGSVKVSDAETSTCEIKSASAYLPADSLDIVEIVVNLEEVFAIDLADNAFDKISTVDDVIKLVEQHIQTAVF